MRLALGVAAASFGLVTAVAGASAQAVPTRVIQGDRVVGGLVMGRARPAAAVARFGTPSSRRPSGASCVMGWRPLALTVTFLDFEGRPCVDGVAVGATVTDRARWRTALGLRVGDGVARLERLYPRASRHAGGYRPYNGYWLVPRRTCAEVGGFAYPGSLARIRAGRVSALVLTIAACE